MKKFLFTLFLCLSFSAAASEPFVIGHNLSATSHLFAPGQCTLGFMYIGCGLNEKTSLGTSPWIWGDYRMINFALRFQTPEESSDQKSALQIDYFKSMTQHKAAEGMSYSNENYQMESLWLLFIKSYHLHPYYWLHLNFHTNYYFDEKMPFSLRRPYLQKTPWQLNVTTLHELTLVENWKILGELGLLDFARSPLHFHSGASLGKTINNLSFHFGFSMSSTLNGLFSPLGRVDYQQTLKAQSVDGYNSASLDESQVTYDFAIHPEFSLQLFF